MPPPPQLSGRNRSPPVDVFSIAAPGPKCETAGNFWCPTPGRSHLGGRDCNVMRASSPCDRDSIAKSAYFSNSGAPRAAWKTVSQQRINGKCNRPASATERKPRRARTPGSPNVSSSPLPSPNCWRCCGSWPEGDTATRASDIPKCSKVFRSLRWNSSHLHNSTG